MQDAGLVPRWRGKKTRWYARPATNTADSVVLQNKQRRAFLNVPRPRPPQPTPLAHAQLPAHLARRPQRIELQPASTVCVASLAGRAKRVAMSDESETPGERVSRFREHTNTNSSIRAPPAELWRDVDTEGLMDQFHDDNAGTPAVTKDGAHPRRIMERQPVAERRIAQPRGATTAAGKGSGAATTAASSEGALGRFSRVFASVFGGVLGKRKAGHADAEPAAAAADSTSVSPEQAVLDERKRAAEEAYHVAKAQGLLPAPKVFVRPGMAPRAWSAGTSSSSRSSIRVVEADDARHGRGGHHLQHLYTHCNSNQPDSPKHSYTRSHSYPVPSAPAPRPPHPGKRRKIAQQGRPDQAEEALAPRQQPRGEAREREKGTRKRAWE